ncbi:MAG: LysM peptidoglycan-binding domain-containing protein [Chloroflexota bacterium]|jgi:GH25 family lysozyme M1 (1,4-beta-N-acetylmuramidase)
MATVPGIDVSYWNAGIDWPKVRATGQRFVFAKATEGDFYSDPTFPANWSGAKTAGLLRGAYHFFRANVDGRKQAKKFIDYIKSTRDNGELPPVLDLETHDGQTNARIISRAKDWLDEVEAAFGKKPIIYSGQYFLQDHFSEAGGGPPSWAKDYPLWLAQYPNVYVEGQQPFLPRGWFKWTFWQYSEKGRLNGINANVDLNVFNGTLEELYKFAGAQIVTETAPQEKTHTVKAGDTFESIAIKYGVTVRELVSANPQLLKSGDTLKVPVAVAIPSESGTGSGSAGGSGTSVPKTHTVKAGDTLYAIAIRYNTTVAAIATLNNISDPNKIKVGQVLQIP